MTFFDRFRKWKSGRKGPTKQEEIDAEALWESLCENPNQEDRIQRLMALCERVSGMPGVFAALEELTKIEGGILPARHLEALRQQQKDVYSAAFHNKMEEAPIVLDIPTKHRSASVWEDDGERAPLFPDSQNSESESEIFELENDGTSENPSYLFSMENPVWATLFPELRELLPKKNSLGKVGLYFFSYLHREFPNSSAQPDIGESDLTMGIPLLLSERLFSLSRFVPVVLCPVRFDEGICDNKLEADVQTLQAICAQQKLEYLITGTVSRQKNVFGVRVFIYHRKQQSIRIVSKDIPLIAPEEKLLGLLREISSVLVDKNAAQYEPEDYEILYTEPGPLSVVDEIRREQVLLLTYLVRKSYCSSMVLDKWEAGESLDGGGSPCSAPDLLTRLLVANPTNQMSFLKLMCWMDYCSTAGRLEYLKCRSALYHSADKNRQLPIVKLLEGRINHLLKEV